MHPVEACITPTEPLVSPASGNLPAQLTNAAKPGCLWVLSVQRPDPDFGSYHFPITACCSAPNDRNTVIPSSDDMMTAASSCSP